MSGSGIDNDIDIQLIIEFSLITISDYLYIIFSLIDLKIWVSK